MLENWYMYQTPDSKELIPELSLGNTGNTKICLMGRYMFVCLFVLLFHISVWLWGRTGLVVRASDSGSGDPGSILGRVGVLFP